MTKRTGGGFLEKMTPPWPQRAGSRAQSCSYLLPTFFILRLNHELEYSKLYSSTLSFFFVFFLARLQ